jgi:phosphoribosylformylglycinamidine (FGAM) synthase PurS component
MANPTTAAEWKQVAANAQAQIDAVNQQKAQGEAQITALEQQLLANGQQISDYLIANPRITSRDPGLLALQAQTDTIKQNLAKTEVYVRATLTSQLFQLRATINNANTQAGVASTGAPNTNTNTPPETVVPDQSNTAVTTTTEPEPVQQSVIDPNTDPNTNIGSEPVVENATPQFATGQNEATNAAFLEANASEQQVIDPNSDPNTNIGEDGQNQDT